MQTISHTRKVEPRFYKLLPEKQWQADIVSIEALIDAKTKAILINNPSNPCGSVYPVEHLRALVAVAEKHHLIIIADEIYGNLTFAGCDFIPLASLSKDVPVITVGGIAKEFLVPGWRVGWAIVHDRHGILKDVTAGMFRLSQLTLGANAPIMVRHAAFVLHAFTIRHLYTIKPDLYERATKVSYGNTKSYYEKV